MNADIHSNSNYKRNRNLSMEKLVKKKKKQAKVLLVIQKRMIPLQTNRLILTWFLIYPRAKNTTYQIAFAQYTFAVLCFFVTSVGVYGSVRFFNQYVHTDLDASLFGVLQAAALFSATYMQMCAHIFRPQIIEMIEHFSRFYKSRKFLFHFNLK